MISARDIILLFGFFFSMFYVFKFGTTPTEDKRNGLCIQLQALQAETVADISPMILADASGRRFEDKVDSALGNLRGSPNYIARQNQIWKIKHRLSGHSCPALTLVQLTKLAIEES